MYTHNIVSYLLSANSWGWQVGLCSLKVNLFCYRYISKLYLAETNEC